MRTSPPTALKSSFTAVADASTRLLILGSLPGDASLRRGQYYAHPRNQFWRLMEVVIDQDLVGRTYDDRLARLVEAGVGLWDVIRSAERSGSLDADIRRHTPNPLATFIGALPALRAVAFNGAAASVIGRKALSQDLGLALITLPSSSPAHAALSFDSKLERWRRLGSVLI